MWSIWIIKNESFSFLLEQSGDLRYAWITLSLLLLRFPFKACFRLALIISGKLGFSKCLANDGFAFFVEHFIGDAKNSVSYWLAWCTFYIMSSKRYWTGLSIMSKTSILFFVVANLECRCIFVPGFVFFLEHSREEWKALVALHCKQTVLLNVHYKKITSCKVIWKEGLLVGKQTSSWHIYTATPSIPKMPNRQDKYRYNV